MGDYILISIGYTNPPKSTNLSHHPHSTIELGRLKRSPKRHAGWQQTFEMATKVLPIQ